MYKVIPFDYLLTNIFSRLFPHNIFFDYFFSFFSLKGASVFIWLLIIVIVVFLEEKKHPGLSIRDKKFALFFSGTFMLTFFIVDILLKNFFRRPRPYLLSKIFHSNLIAGICPADFSFPSAHAATAFAAAFVLSYFDKKRSWFYYIVALFISYSRIYLGCHYFFDVAAGAIIGSLLGTIVIKILNRIYVY
jgi:undecaprenyl-diphosphatase